MPLFEVKMYAPPRHFPQLVTLFSGKNPILGSRTEQLFKLNCTSDYGVTFSTFHNTSQPQVVVSGKLRGQRAKSMKFVDGLMIHTGEPKNSFVDTAVRHVLLRQGVLWIKVKVMLPWDPQGTIRPEKPLPDNISILEPKCSDENIDVPYSTLVEPKVTESAPVPPM